jgi:hypothetical protein
MSEVSRTTSELEEHLRDQVHFMTQSAQSYDNGFTSEAKRLAVALRILLHDTTRSRSVLGQLGIKERLLWCDTATDYDPENLMTQAGLTQIQLEPAGATFVPRLSQGVVKPKLPFEMWWNAVVVADAAQSLFTRRTLVLTVADRDGGAHVDPQLDAAYSALTRGNSMAWYHTSDGTQVKLVERASVRQIAYEVLTSLEEQCPQYARKDYV